MSIIENPIIPSALENLREDDNAYSAAYEAVKDELAAMSEAELDPLNVDLNAATTTVLGALPELRALREQLVQTLADFDVERFDKLETYAAATLYLHSAHVSRSQPAPDLPMLVEQATQLRDAFVADAQALVQRGLLDGAVLTERPRGPGHRALALELLTLALRLRAAWPRIEGRSALQYGEFATAEALCKRIQRLVGLREQSGPARLAALALERQRAHTLLFRTYDATRRAVAYVRWKQGDVDDIAPSLYAGRGGSKSASASAPASASGSAQADRGARDAASPKAGEGPVMPKPSSNLPALDPNDPGNDPFAST